MLVLSGKEADPDYALKASREALHDGRALERFRRMVQSQGGNVAVIDNPGLLPQARHVVEIQYEESESVWVKDVDARSIAQIVLETGAGRRNAEDTVDHSSGLSALVCVGDRLEPGNLIGRLHYSVSGQREDWERRLRESVSLSTEPVEPPRRILKKIM